MIIIRIGKLTLDGYSNYGNLLQNYALQQALLNYADTVDTIWHDKDQSCIPGSYHLTWKEMIKFILNWNDFRTFYHKQHQRKMINYRPRCLEGSIGVYRASSSPMGRLARAIQKY